MLRCCQTLVLMSTPRRLAGADEVHSPPLERESRISYCGRAVTMQRGWPRCCLAPLGILLRGACSALWNAAACLRAVLEPGHSGLAGRCRQEHVTNLALARNSSRSLRETPAAACTTILSACSLMGKSGLPVSKVPLYCHLKEAGSIHGSDVLLGRHTRHMKVCGQGATAVQWPGCCSRGRHPRLELC